MNHSFETFRDLRNWCDSALGADATESDIGRLTEIIRHDPNRPAWGHRWNKYLETLDVWALATQ